MPKTILNRHHTNAAIKTRQHNDEYMRKLGFTDYRKTHWYFSRMLHKGDISFNIMIPKAGIDDDLSIDILDEDFLQPYDYQGMLARNPKNKFALEIQEKVEYWMDWLEKNEIIYGHNRGDYI